MMHHLEVSQPVDNSLLALYMASSGRERGVKVVASNYFIDPINGNDNNPGTTRGKPFKTWNHLTNLFGDWTILSPQPTPLLTITLLNDLPITDPITWMNIMAPGSTALVQGQTKVLMSGTLTAVQTNTPFSNIPGVVEAAGLGQSQVGKQIQITAGTGIGARAMVGADLTGGKVQVTEWCTGSSSIGDAITGIGYGNLPAPGDSYQIVDFTNAFFGFCLVGFDTSNLLFGTVGTVGGLSFQQMHFPITPNGQGITTLPTMLNLSTIVDFADTIFDQVASGEVTAGQYGFANCAFRGGASLGGGSGSQNIVIFGGQIPLTVAEGGTGFSFFDLLPGSITRFDGDFANIGVGIPDPNGGPAGANVNSSGIMISGPMSWWNTQFPLNPGNGFVVFPFSSPIFGSLNYDPLYGDGNALPISLEGGLLEIQTGDPSGATAPIAAIIPTIAFPNQVGAVVTPPLSGSIAWLFSGSSSQDGGANTTDIGRNSCPFDLTVPAYASLRDNTWANLAVTIGGGGFRGLTAGAAFGAVGHNFQSNSARPENNVGPQTCLTFTAVIQ